MTADATGTIARRYEFARPWLSARFTNSVFSNVGHPAAPRASRGSCHQRPYVTDGNAAHFSGGLDLSAGRMVTLGFVGFALRPTGAQTVHSRTMQSNMISGDDGPVPGGPSSGGMTPGGHTIPGVGGGTIPAGVSMSSYDRAQQTVISADELRDYGASAWVSIRLHQGLSLNITTARSFPFHLDNGARGNGH